MKKYSKLPAFSDNQQVIDRELSQNLAKSNAISLGMTSRGGTKGSSPADKRWVLNNVLRLHNAGKSLTTVIRT